MVFKSDEQLELYVTIKLGQALDNTLEVVLTELKKIIEEKVYGWQSPSELPWGGFGGGLTSGNRTGQFYDSWQKVKPIMVGNLIQGEINQAIEVMQVFMIGDPQKPTHIDREELADIINTGDGYDFGKLKGVARPYWDIFTMWLAQNLHNVFFMECLKLGIPIQKV